MPTRGADVPFMTPDPGSINVDSSPDEEPFQQRISIQKEYRISLTCVFLCVILFTTLGNLATVVVVKRDRRLRSVSNLYLASLALADLLVGSVVMLFMLLYTVTFNGKWLFAQALCDLWNFVDYVSCSASLTNVCAIAVDRYEAVSQPLRAFHRRTKRRALRYILAAWAVPVVGWLAIIIALRLENGRPPDGQCFLEWNPPYTALVVAAIFVYVPLLMIIVLFVTIIWHLKHHMSGMQDSLSRTSSLQHHPSMDSCADNTADKGGISFNARFSVEPMGESMPSDPVGKGIPMLPLGQPCRAPATGSSSQVALQSDLQYDLEYFQGGKHFRSIGTSTSPERYGLVRSIATNTSPSLTRRASSPTMVNLPDVTDIGPYLGSTSSLASPGGSEFHSDSESETTFQSLSSTDSSPGPGPHLPRWRRGYASLLRMRRESSLERSRLRQQLKAAKTLGIILAFLLLCWVPFAILWPVRTFCPGCVSQRAYDLSIWTNYLNSSINPIIYCLCNPNFRKAFKRLVVRR